MTKACWAQRLSAETLRGDFKGVKDYLQRYRDTSETSESSSERELSCPHGCCTRHLEATASTPSLTPQRCGKKKTALREKSDVCADKRLKERNRWCWCRWCEPAGHAAARKFPSDVSTHSEILINVWRETIIDLNIDLWLLLRLAVTVALGKRRFFFIIYISLKLIKTFIQGCQHWCPHWERCQRVTVCDQICLQGQSY